MEPEPPALTPQMQAAIRAKVDAGLYDSSGAVLAEALRLLDERDALDALRARALRDEIQRGADSGAGIPAQEVFADLRARIDAQATQRGERVH
jgi:antitoxin ParD1/3/4